MGSPVYTISGRQRPIVLAAAVSLAAAALVPVATAGDDPRSPASLDVEVQGDSGFTYHMVTEEDPVREVTGSFDIDTFRMDLAYTSSNGSAELRRVNASLALEGLYEFRDLNENGRFDLGDRIVRFDPVEPNRRAEVEHVETPGKLEILRATTPLEGDGEVQFDVYLTPESIRLTPDEDLRPLDNKIDIVLRDIRSTREDTSFGLAMRLEGSQLDRTDAREVRVEGDGANFLYEWSDTAILDGVSTPLNSTLVEQHVTRDDADHTELAVVHVLEPGNEVELEQSFRVEETSPPLSEALTGILGNPLVYLGGLVAAVLVVGGNAWLKLQENEDESGRLGRFSRE